MAYRTPLVCFVAAMLSAGDHRTDPRPAAAEAEARKAAEPAGDRPNGDRLAKPVPVEVGGTPLEPWGIPGLFVGDFDGDGRPDLLLENGREGRLVIYRNVGTRTEPRLSGPQWFDDAVPTGRIPKG
jgi:hypothetical protein